MTETKTKPLMKAVRLYGQMVPPKTKFCEKCDTVLQYWKGGRGNVYLCPKCMKVVT